MLAEVVFVTQLLGLVAGSQPLELSADPGVVRIDLRRNGRSLATLTKPPWKAVVNFGEELAPFELTAHAFDAAGREAGRDAQAVNVARGPAAVSILLTRKGDAVDAAIRPSHVLGHDVVKMTMRLDGKVVADQRGSSPVRLPAFDPAAIHVLRADVRFSDDVVVRREIVFGGIYSEEIPVELSPVMVRGAAACVADERRVEPVASERGDSTIFFVVNGRPGAMEPALQQRGNFDTRFAFTDAELRIVSPVAQAVQARELVRTDIFPSTEISGDGGIRRLLRHASIVPPGTAQVADAVAASAVRAMSAARRRAIVVVLGEDEASDRSRHAPAVVRRYCERVGVPLYVWSYLGPRPDLRASWGAVRDVSTARALAEATDELRRDLESQRIAWMPLSVLEAARATCTR